LFNPLLSNLEVFLFSFKSEAHSSFEFGVFAGLPFSPRNFHLSLFPVLDFFFFFGGPFYQSWSIFPLTPVVLNLVPQLVQFGFLLVHGCNFLSCFFSLLGLFLTIVAPRCNSGVSLLLDTPFWPLAVVFLGGVSHPFCPQPLSSFRWTVGTFPLFSVAFFLRSCFPFIADFSPTDELCCVILFLYWLEHVRN